MSSRNFPENSLPSSEESEALKMTVHFRVWLKERENPKSRMQFIISRFFVEDMLEAAHELMIEQTDTDWICYRVDLVSIEYFNL